MLELFMRIPLVRDFFAIYIAIFRENQKPSIMPRWSFWKAALGGFIFYVLSASLFNAFWFYALMPYVKRLGELYADIGVVVTFLLFLFVFLLMLPAEVWRLRDAGRSGWWVLLWLVPYLGPLVLAILWLLPSRFTHPVGERFR